MSFRKALVLPLQQDERALKSSAAEHSCSDSSFDCAGVVLFLVFAGILPLIYAVRDAYADSKQCCLPATAAQLLISLDIVPQQLWVRTTLQYSIAFCVNTAKAL